ncbi:hypothetical protein Tco_0455865 [Tanacetum coccineum]
MPKTDRSTEGIVEKVLNDSGEGTSKQVNRSKVKKFKKVKKGKKVKKVQNKHVMDNPGEGTSQGPSSRHFRKWTKKKITDSKTIPCPFRLYASWMSSEHCFQIKSLILDHKCCRNYNLGSLVTFKWIAAQYANEIIADPFISYRKMKDDIRHKFMIDVSLGQCKIAKQKALFDHEGGLIKHYSKLYDYMQAILDSNPGSTCRLDVDESNTSRTFKRIYICFKGVKDGWLAGCRKINQQAYEYLVARDLNSWSGAFFEMDRRCAAFENGISESFNRAILDQRSKPIITMLEEIRLYIMQRLFQMNKIVYPSGFQELEVRCGDDSFGVNLQHKSNNKSTCKSETQPKPPTERKTVRRKRQPIVGETASRGGLGSKGGRGVRGGGTTTGRGGRTGRGVRGGGRGVKGGGKDRKGGGMGGRGGGRGGTTKSDGHLTAEQDEEIFRKFVKEESRNEEEYSVIHVEPDEPMDQTTNEDVAADMDQTTNKDVAAVDNGKRKAVDEATDKDPTIDASIHADMALHHGMTCQKEDADVAGSDMPEVLRLSHGGDVEADGNCLFTTSKKAMGLKITAKELRMRKVKRFLDDVRCRESDIIDEEVKMLAKKDDRGCLDDGINELVNLGMLRFDGHSFVMMGFLRNIEGIGPHIRYL